MRLLPREQRDAMYAVYGFCRTVDDIADGDAPVAAKLASLGWWKEEVDRLYGGAPTDPVAHALLDPVARFTLPREELLAVLAGMEMDVRGEMVAPTQATLELYCRRVAGAVGLLSLRIFRCDEPQAHEFAVALGEALQLTNLLRDLAEDARLGRLYLPLEMLQDCRVASTDPDAVLAHPALPAVCRMVADRAEGRFRHASRLLAGLDQRRLRAAVAMMALYRRLLSRLRDGGWTQLERRLSLGRAEKLWVALRAMALAKA